MVEPAVRVEKDESEGAEPTAADFTALGAAHLPTGLTTQWPVPRVPVLGDRDGAWARVEAYGLLAILGGIGRLPIGMQRALTTAIARVARAADRKRSETARAFLRQAFGALPERELDERVLDAWRHLVRLAVDWEAFPRRVPIERIRDHVRVELTPDVERVLAARRGSVIVSGHIGDWEVGCGILPWVGFDPFYGVAKPPRNRPLSLHVQLSRERRGFRVLPRRGAMKHAGTILASGGALGLLLDQRARKKPVIAPFFGRPARCDRSAGVLLRRLEAPIVFPVCYLTEQPFRYRLCFPAVISPEEVRDLRPEEIATRINGVLEAMIRAAPEQYLWLHDRYRGAPPV